MNKTTKQWTTKQVQLLQSIKNQNKQKKWKIIAKDLSKKGLKRTQQECRNKWVNCLDPNINHQSWTENQLKILYQQYNRNCSQWSIIQKSLPGRTQIKIKNHFYGVVRNIVRNILKYFNSVQTKQSELSNKINPISLQLIYRGQQKYSFLGSLMRKTVQKMKYSFNKAIFVTVIQENIAKFQQLNQKIIEQVYKKKEKQYENQVQEKSQMLDIQQENNNKTQNNHKKQQKQIILAQQYFPYIPFIHINYQNQISCVFPQQNLIFIVPESNQFSQGLPISFQQESKPCQVKYVVNINNYLHAQR